MLIVPYNTMCFCKHPVTLNSCPLGYIEMESRLTSWAWMKTTTLSYSKSPVWET